jgi:fucose permease
VDTVKSSWLIVALYVGAFISAFAGIVDDNDHWITHGLLLGILALLLEAENDRKKTGVR